MFVNEKKDITKGQHKMANSVFRQKSIDKINSPESLNDYVKVINPSVWMILIGTIILIVGAFVFSAFGEVDTNMNVAVSVTDGIITAYIDEANIEKVTLGMGIQINGTDYPINEIPNRPVKASEIDEYVLHKGDMEMSQWIYEVEVDGKLDDGVYKGTIVVESISPILYVFN